MLNSLPQTSPLIEDVADLIWLAQEIAHEIESISVTEYPLAHWTLLAQLSAKASKRAAQVQASAQEVIVELTNLSGDSHWEYETA